MSTSRLTLYNTEITPARNAKIDNIRTYLNGCDGSTVGTFQYIKIDLALSIKVRMDQSVVAEKMYNYACIEQDGRAYYFFINGARWTAKKTVTFDLVMDTINTWWDELQWNDKTTITRQHMDRWVGQDNAYLINKIDRYNEGFNPVLNWSKKEETIEGRTCYVVYKTRDGITQDDITNPISATVFYDDAITIAPAINNPVTKIDWRGRYSDDKLYFITSSGLENASISTSISTMPTINFNEYNSSNNDYLRAIRFDYSADGTFVEVSLYWYRGEVYPYAYNRTTSYTFTIGTQSTLTFTNIRTMNYVARAGNTNLRNINVIDGLEDKIVLNSGVIPAEITTKFDDLDRSSSLFMKIVQVPYDIVGLTYNGSTNSYDLPANWAFNPGWKGIESDLTNKNFATDIGGIGLDDAFKTPLVNTPSSRDNYLGYRYEPKLWNSEFTNIFLNFDGEQMQIKPERITPNKNGNAYTNIKFALSNAISSDMMFKLDWTLGSYIKESKYDGTLISSRNMEKPIYTNGYVDYLRNGYNWDQAAVKRQNQNAKINTIMGGVGAALQIGVSAIPGFKAISHAEGELASLTQSHSDLAKEYATFRTMPNVVNTQGPYTYAELGEAVQSYAEQANEARAKLQSIKTTSSGFAGLIAGQAFNSAQSAYNAARSIKSNNNSFSASLANKQAQASGIEGSSNVDLFDQYSGGAKLEYNIFTMSEEDKNNIARVFYYLGYSHPVQEIPDFDTRLWFNFVQCDAVFNDEATCIYNKYIDDIKTRFKMGITVYHDVENQYDFDQEMENWETNIVY